MLTSQKRAELRLATLALLLSATLLGIGTYLLYQKSQELPPGELPGNIRTGAVFR